jgi:hypothetical protein
LPLWPGKRSVLDDDFAGLLYALLERCEALAKEPVDIGFVLPREIMVQAIDLWRPTAEFAEEAPIGASHRVGVRSAERLLATHARRRTLQAWRHWLQAAPPALTLADLEAHLGPLLQQRDPTRALWLTLADGKRAGLLRDQLGRVPCVILESPPSAKSSGREPFDFALSCGVPVVLWLRGSGIARAAELRAELAVLLQQVPAQQLPERLRQLRQQAEIDGGEDHLGRCLGLFWDDMDRLPPTLGGPAAALHLEEV